MGNIGEIEKTIEIEPLEEPLEIPVPEQPQAPVETPETEPVPA